MPFSFTFVVPGLPNPFTALSQQVPNPPQPSIPIGNHACQRRLSPAPSLSPTVPGSRKRRWEPSSAELSESTTTIASTTGFLNLPDARLIKFEMAASHEGSEREYDGMDSGRFHLFISSLALPRIRHPPPAACWIGARVCGMGYGSCDGLRVTNPCPPSPHLQSFFYSPMSSHFLICIHVELPPPKRRRTLAGSIVSTALNACLIGTAVGLTVYRL
jgi:hypothetical protein